jgi:vitamin B12 transporter
MKIVFTLLLFFAMSFAFSQNAERHDTLFLKSLTVSESRSKLFNKDLRVEKIDSLEHIFQQNLTSIIERKSNTFIKNYGPGSLATSSFRGGSAAHTAVIWNGFNIQSPMNGTTDFSLIPAGMIDEVSVQHGGSSATWGSGAIGGAIIMDNHPLFNQGTSLQLSTQAASFRSFQNFLNFKSSQKNFISSTKMLRHTSENNFPFYNNALYGQPIQHQVNAQLSHLSLMHENYFITGNNLFKARIWLQESERNIPPFMLQAVSKANQADKTLRGTFEWQRNLKKSVLFVRTAYFNEQNIYNDSIASIFSNNRFQSSINETELRIYPKEGHLINVGLNYTYITAESPGYLTPPRQQRTALFASYNKSFKDYLQLFINGRQEIVDGEPIPLTPSFGFSANIRKHFGIKGNISRNYRLPTLNDLYWNPGGNPGLLPESGWSRELTLEKVQSPKKSFRWDYSLTGFSRIIKNWIIWLPEGFYWQPKNLMEVWSRGIEQRANIDLNFQKVRLTFRAMYDIIYSTTEKNAFSGDASIGKQLIYVPEHQARSGFQLMYKSFFFAYDHSYIGYRYTSADNSMFLQPYQLGTVRTGASFKIKEQRFQSAFNIYNAWNSTYQVMAWRPMPMRHYELSITFNLSLKNKKTKS